MTAELLGRDGGLVDGQPTRGSPVPTLAFRSAADSVRGPRPDNQDAGCAGERLLAVADGVGGCAGGGIAAALAIDHLVRHPPIGTGGTEAWQVTVLSADARIRSAARLRPEIQGMATTLTAIALGGASDAVLLHIGDSRAYLLRDGHLEQLTSDTTLVQGLLDAGVLTEEQARTHPLRSVLLAALRGQQDDAAALRTSVVPLRPGDRLLLCTDGVSGYLSEQRLRSILVAEAAPASAVQRLLRAALHASTRDNLTAVVGDVFPAVGPHRPGMCLVGAARPVPTGG